MEKFWKFRQPFDAVNGCELARPVFGRRVGHLADEEDVLDGAQERLVLHDESATLASPVPAASVTLLDAAGVGAGVTLQLNTIGFNSSGSSGAQQTQFGNSVLSPPYPQAVCSFYTTTTVILTQNPDVSVALGTASPNEVDTAGATTAALQNLVSFQIGTAVAERDTANQIATPLTGYRISPPLALPQYPITNSVIHWDQFLYAAGSTILVETSVDNGISWQVATSGQPTSPRIRGPNLLRGCRVPLRYGRGLLRGSPCSSRRHSEQNLRHTRRMPCREQPPLSPRAAMSAQSLLRGGRTSQRL